jgi:hypothetical protein
MNLNKVGQSKLPHPLVYSPTFCFATVSLSEKAACPEGTNGRDKLLYFVTNNFEVNVFRGIYLKYRFESLV